jgi:hypothetical protein
VVGKNINNDVENSKPREIPTKSKEVESWAEISLAREKITWICS